MDKLTHGQSCHNIITQRASLCVCVCACYVCVLCVLCVLCVVCVMCVMCCVCYVCYVCYVCVMCCVCVVGTIVVPASCSFDDDFASLLRRMGRPKRSLNCLSVPRKPGIRKSNSDHSSRTLF